MANQLKMALVDSIITLHGHGWSRRRIARELGVHRETVGPYVGLAASEAKPANNAPAGSTPLATGGSTPPVPTRRDSTGAGHASLGIDPSKPAGNAPTGMPSTATPWRGAIDQKLDQGLTAQRIYQPKTGTGAEFAGAAS